MYYNAETRKNIKETAKDHVRARLWPTILACGVCGLPKMLSALLLPLAGLDAMSARIAELVSDSGASLPQAEALYSTFLSRFGLVMLLMLAVDFLLTGPLYMGIKRYLLALYQGGAPALSESIYCFSSGKAYWRSFRANLWIWLYSLLWGLLLIPGAIVLVLLSMFGLLLTLVGTVGYVALTCWVMTRIESLEGAYNLLCDAPDMHPRQAIRITGELFRSRMWELFVFVLSFLGWAAVLSLPGYLLSYFGMDAAATIVDFAFGLFLVAYRGAAFVGYVEALRNFWKQEYEKGADETPAQ